MNIMNGPGIHPRADIRLRPAAPPANKKPVRNDQRIGSAKDINDPAYTTHERLLAKNIIGQNIAAADQAPTTRKDHVMNNKIISNTTINSIESIVDKVLPEIIELRHTFHQAPELSHAEFNTSKMILAYLRTIPGLTIREGLGSKVQGDGKGTGIVVTLGADKPGKSLAFRADIDGLPVTEETGLPYASRNPGKMHACGHDGHIAVLLGTIKTLALIQDQLKQPITFIFQPAEETASGAKAMVRDGALKNVSHIFGLHGWPQTKTGTLLISKGPIMAHGDMFDISIPAEGRSPTQQLIAAATIIETITRGRPADMTKRNDDDTVVTVTHLSAPHAGTVAFNIIPNSFTLTLRANTSLSDTTFKDLEHMLAQTSQKTKAKITITRDHTRPDTARISIIGIGGHGAMPELVNSPIPIMARVIKMVSKHPGLDIIEVTSPDRKNSFKNAQTLELKGTIRTLTNTMRTNAAQLLHEAAVNIRKIQGLNVQVNITNVANAVHNDPATTDQVITILKRSFAGNMAIEPMLPTMGSEDFGDYLPGVTGGTFIALGVIPKGAQGHPALHNSRFNFTDAAIKYGILSFVEIARRFNSGRP